MAKGVVVGLNRGHVVSKIETPSWLPSKAPRKRVSLIRRVISELAGRSPYEKKVIELLKQKMSNVQKKAYKMIKKRLGSHKRAMKKRVELNEVVANKK